MQSIWEYRWYGAKSNNPVRRRGYEIQHYSSYYGINDFADGRWIAPGMDGLMSDYPQYKIPDTLLLLNGLTNFKEVET